MNVGVREIIPSYDENAVRGVDDNRQVLLETCLFPPSNPEDIASDWEGRVPPGQVCGLWMESDGMNLYYRDGMYGLQIYGSKDSRDATLRALSDDDELVDTDIVVGSFQGCDELLVYSRLDGWLVSSGVEVRSEWLRLGETLSRFLSAFRDGGTEGSWRDSFY